MEFEAKNVLEEEYSAVVSKFKNLCKLSRRYLEHLLFAKLRMIGKLFKFRHVFLGTA